MSRPEDVHDRAWLGELMDDDAPALEAHARGCPTCAMGVRVAADFAAEGAARAGDAAKLEALVDGAVRRLEREAASVDDVVALRPRRRPARAARAVLLAAALLVVAAGAVAATLRSRPKASEELPAPAPPVPVASTTPMAASIPRVTEDVAPVPSTSVAPAVRLPARSASSSPQPAGSAAELFARANQARCRGDDAKAVALYRELERRFPGSAEALESHMDLGRLLLDEMGEPAAALAELDRYLAAGGVLREEALVGRAVALGRLGRTAEERAAWQTLLDEHPDSIQADRARKRLEQLR